MIVAGIISSHIIEAAPKFCVIILDIIAYIETVSGKFVGLFFCLIGIEVKNDV
jgi:hypothetical protein